MSPLPRHAYIHPYIGVHTLPTLRWVCSLGKTFTKVEVCASVCALLLGEPFTKVEVCPLGEPFNQGGGVPSTICPTCVVV